RVVADRRTGVRQHPDLLGGHESGMRTEQLRTQRSDVVQVFHGPQAVLFARAVHTGEVFVDVDLQDSIGLGTGSRGAPQYRVGRVLRNRDRQRRVHQPVGRPPVQVLRTAVAVRADLT